MPTDIFSSSGSHLMYSIASIKGICFVSAFSVRKNVLRYPFLINDTVPSSVTLSEFRPVFAFLGSFFTFSNKETSLSRICLMIARYASSGFALSSSASKSIFKSLNSFCELTSSSSDRYLKSSPNVS